MAKKILHLTISSEIGGGPEHILQLIKGTTPQFESHIACPRNGAYFNKFIDVTSNRITLLPHRKFRILALLKLIKYVKLNKIDILHSHGKGAGLYCRLINIFIRIPAIHTPHGINKKIEEGFTNKIYLLFERLLSVLINCVIFVSRTEFEYAKKLNIWGNVHSVIINNGTKIITEQEIYNWRKVKREALKWEDKKVVITASRFDFQKNTIEFCEIAGALPQYLFVIIGEGELKTECEEYCVKLNIRNVLFLGTLTDPLHYFAASDVYLSTSRWEGLSMAILESMSVGLPVVATKVIGNIDLVKVGLTGLLYNLGEINEALNCIANVLETNNQINFAKNAKEFHDLLFSSQNMCDKTCEVYTKIFN